MQTIIANKMKNAFTLAIFLLFLLPENAVAQPSKTDSLPGSMLRKYALSAPVAYNFASPYYLSLLKGILPASVQVVRKLNDSIGILHVPTQEAFNTLTSEVKVIAVRDNWKLSPYLEKELVKMKEGLQPFILTGLTTDALLSVLQEKTSSLLIVTIHRPTNSVVVKCKPSYLKEALLPLKEVIFADLTTTAHPETAIIGYDRSFHGINAVDILIPDANGKDIVAGVKEQKPDETDLDIWKRVLPSSLATATTSYHATVITSIVGGAGNSSYKGRGIAWASRFFPSSFSNLFADDEAVLQANKVTVQNHSYGTVVQQFYGAEAASYDLLAWNNKNYIAVMSAGNQGDAAATEGPYANLTGFANLTGNFKMAKNVVTVAAIDNKENIPVQSSAGPAYDGRLAPQLTALGPSGTSDAAAIVTGTIAVMQQVYADSNDSIPPASLVKAILYNTAEDVSRPGIDYKTGYGLLNSYAAIRAIKQKQFDGGALTAREQWSKTISVPVNTAELKVTLSWTDSTAQVNNHKALINDLDLEVTELKTGTVYQPWVLPSSPNKDLLAALPTRKRDSLNTAEQVSIRLPAAGDYQIRVKATAVSTASLPFHVAYQTDTLHTFYFTNPLPASDLHTTVDDNLAIRWTTFVADSNDTGNLLISYDNGASWQGLKNGIKLTSQKYSWPIKDTTAAAMLKMETSFGNFFSPAFLLSRPTTMQVDFNCTDSFRLSWNRNSLATAYRLYTLTDSPYLKPVQVVVDSFVVLQRSEYPGQIFAVEPLLNNSLPAARSAAINTTAQGVQCFYRTLNYNLLDTNKLNLLLELTGMEYVDSVFFENVTASGQLLQNYGNAKVSQGTSVYSLLVNEVPSGTTYLRGRIKLKNGAVIYTEIVPVLTSGKKFIWFYPVPLQRNGELRFMLQQGIPSDNRLQFFDINGRLLRNYSSMPDKISTANFPPGLIFYKLLTLEGSTLETGKLLIIQ
jgi:hypothetical protein